MNTKHTDSVEATLEILRHKYALYGDEGYSHDLLQDIRNALTTLQATQSQQVEEAVREIYSHFSWCRECGEGPACSDALAIAKKYGVDLTPNHQG